MDLSGVTREYVDSLNYADTIVSREAMLTPRGRDILAVVGARRVGKTFLMLLRARELLDAGEQVVFVSFDEPPLRSLDSRSLASMVRSEYPGGKIHLFLDEIQEWQGWDWKLRWLHDVMDFQIYVSGSSSSLLSSEIPSRLRGRYSSVVVFPFSFREISAGVTAEGFRETGTIVRRFKEYLEYGGFPEVWLYRSRDKLASILETCLYRDIVERYGIRDISTFRQIYYYVLFNYSNKITFRSLCRMISGGVGVDVDVKTVANYLHYMESAFIIHMSRFYTQSERLRAVRPRKIYIVDHGPARLNPQGLHMGRIYENIVAVELLRRGYQISYYEQEDFQVDFVAARNGRAEQLVEVTYDDTLIDEKAGNLRRAMKRLEVKNSLLITDNVEKQISMGEAQIRVEPLWKWLLSTG